MAHRVLLVRQWDAQTTGGSCCGRLEGAGAEFGGDEFAHNRCAMEEMGAVYRALRSELPNVDIQVVDPRNVTWLVPTIYRDARRGGASRGDAARTVLRGVSYTAIIVDGRIVARGEVPGPEAAVDAVLGALAAA